jgi:PAS domain S-box-containing protein
MPLPLVGRFLTGPRRRLLPLWLLGLLLSALAGGLVQRHNDAALDARLRLLVDEKVGFVQAQFLRYENGVRGTLGAVLAAGGSAVTRGQFEAYSKARDMAREFPGARGFGFVRRVPRADEAVFLARARAEGPTDFSIRELGAHPGEHFVLQYLYPRQGNEDAWGLDLAGDTRRREAAMSAMRLGQAQLTAPLTLVGVPQHPGGGVVLFVPVYQGGDVPATPAGREAAIAGWAVAPVVVPEVLHSAGVAGHEFAYALRDASDGTTLFSSPGYVAMPADTAARRAGGRLSMYGRTWSLDAHALPGLTAADQLPEGWKLTAGLSMLCTLLAFTACQWLQVRQRRLEMQAEAEEFTAGIVEAAPQALLVVDDRGIIVRANPQAATLFGCALGDLVELPVDELVGRSHQRDHAQLRAGYDGRIRPVGSRPGLGARRRDGSEFTASLHLSPLRIGGRQFVVAGLTDITAQQEAFAALERSERRWQEVAHVLPGIVWSCDAQGASEFVNQRWSDYTGQPSDPVPTQAQWVAAVHPDDRAEVVAAWLHCVASRTPYSIEYRLRRHDGAYRWFSVRGAPLLDGEGQVLRWVGAYNDIDDRHQAELRLRETLQHEEQRVAERTAELDKARRDLKNILDALPSLISYWDRDLINRFANAAVRQWLGLDPDVVRRPHLREVLGEALFEQSLPHAQAALRGEPRTFERSFKRPDGPGLRHAITHYLPDIVDGEVRGFYSLVHDVTEIAEGRRALAIERERLHNILRGTDAGTWEWNVQTGELRVNERWAGMLGLSLQTLQPVRAQAWQQLAHPEDFARAREPLLRHFRGEIDFFECEGRMHHHDGHWVWVHVSGRVMTRTPDGRAEWMFGISQDITERHAVAAALQAAKQVAEAANAAKSEFLANMSHEIRTPLNAVIGLAYLLEQSALDAEQRDSVARIQVASRTLLGMINDVLDLAKIEARQMDLELRPFDLRALLQDLHDLFAPQARRKGVALVVDEASAAPDLVVGDDTRLRQILTNLLSNALKFTDRGEVALRVHADSAMEGRVRLRFEVSDTGIGIAPEALQRLFMPFTQANAGTTRHYGGTGLGLSIVRRLTDLMGGQTTARSEPGRGSCFEVTVELGLALGRDEAGSVLQVMVAGDDPKRADILTALCRALGWRAEPQPLSQAAARLQPASGQSRTPDLLLVDAGHYPGIPGSASALLAAALTPHAAQVRPAVLLIPPGGGLEAGAHDPAPQPHGMLGWPASSSSLFSAVTRALTRHCGGIDKLMAGQLSLPAEGRALPGVRVLVVDDSDINRDVARRILELQGAVVSTAADGRQALELLRAHPEVCDVVLMDVQMPVMDGLEATRRLRGELSLMRLPVLALTAGALVSERERARVAGMDAFITKPLDPKALVRAVRRHVEQALGRPLPVETASSEITAAAVEHWPQIEGIDVAATAQRMGCDQALFKSLLARLLQEYADLEDEATIGLQLGADAQGFAARLHRLRGSAAMLGVEGLEVVAQAFEDGLREGPLDAATQRELGADLARAMRELRSASAAALAAGSDPAVDAGPIERAELDAFVGLLKRRSLDAEKAFERMAPRLRAVLECDDFAKLHEAMETLQYGAAHAMVLEHFPA